MERQKALTDYDPIDGLIKAVDEHNQAYGAIVPILGSLEPEVAITISSLNACPIFGGIANLNRTRFRLIEDSVQNGLSRNLNDYQVRARELKRALTESSYTPTFKDDDPIASVMDYPNAVEA